MRGFFSASKVQRAAPPRQRMPLCGACGMFKECENPKIEPQGKGGKGILIIGESPGPVGDSFRLHFGGKTGQLLRDTIINVGGKMDRDTWQTSATICAHDDTEKLKPKFITYCHPNLENAMRELQPNVVITLGLSALTSALTGYWKGSVGTMDRWLGWKIPLGTHWLCPTYHPTFLLQKKNELMNRAFEAHIRTAFEIQQERATRKPSPDIEILYDDYEVTLALEEMDRQGGWVAFDYEANCLKPEYPDAKLWSCAVSNGNRTIAFPWIGRSKEAMGRFLRSSRTRKIAANAKYEERFTRKTFGHGVVNWGWDTMLATHCLDNRPGICSLKFQAFIQFGVETYNENIEPYLKTTGDSHYNRIGEIETRTLLQYNGMDAVWEFELAMLQMREMGISGHGPNSTVWRKND